MTESIFEKITKLENQSDDSRRSSRKSDRQALLPSENDDEKITESNLELKSELSTNSRADNYENFENVIKSIKSLNEAIELTRKILKHKKSARQTVAKLLSKLYSSTVSFDDLK